MKGSKYYGLRVAAFYLLFVIFAFLVFAFNIWYWNVVDSRIVSEGAEYMRVAITYASLVSSVAFTVFYVAMGVFFASLRHDAHRCENRKKCVSRVITLHLPGIVPALANAIMSISYTSDWEGMFALNLLSVISMAAAYSLPGCLILGCGVYDLYKFRRKKRRPSAEIRDNAFLES